MAGQRGWHADGTPVNKKRIYESSEECCAAKVYGDTGDLTVLGAFADILDDWQTRKKFAQLLRRVMRHPEMPIHFFFNHAGYGYRPWIETPLQARLRYAWQLAKAELWFKNKDESDQFRIRWVIDDEYDPDSYDNDMPDIAFGCILEEYDARGHINYLTDDVGWRTIGSLWGITFAAPHDDPFADPYHRVVQAEMVRENCL